MNTQAIRQFETLSRRVTARSRRIVAQSLSHREKRLTDILNTYLPEDGTSEYAFVFAMCYGTASGRDFKRIEGMAASINLLQSSTFVIDDVLDESSTRYDEATIWESHGTGMAVACGHLMEAIAVEEMLVEAEKYFPMKIGVVASTLNQITKAVYRGQILDLQFSQSLLVSRADYFRLIELTTGGFFRQLALLGGHLAGRNKQEIDALGHFAFCYGMALQITDDIVDITASRIFTEKDFAADLLNQRPRLPMIVALARTGEEDRKRLISFICNNSRRSRLQSVVTIIKNCGAIEECTRIARKYLNQGERALRKLPNDKTRRTLGSMASQLLDTQLLEES